MKSFLLSIALALVVFATPAEAHKVIASVFASGDSIEGEIGFSNGDVAANHVVEVLDADGNRIGETKTDDDGFFVYTPTRPGKHIFQADLGAGHVAEATMEAADIAAILAKADNQAAARKQEMAQKAEIAAEAANAKTTLPAGSPSSKPAASVITVASLTEEEREAIAKIVRDETRPLRREISAYKEKNDMQSILGGIGYIAGLFGLGFYLAARRRLGT